MFAVPRKQLSESIIRRDNAGVPICALFQARVGTWVESQTLHKLAR